MGVVGLVLERRRDGEAFAVLEERGDVTAIGRPAGGVDEVKSTVTCAKGGPAGWPRRRGGGWARIRWQAQWASVSEHEMSA